MKRARSSALLGLLAITSATIIWVTHSHGEEGATSPIFGCWRKRDAASSGSTTIWICFRDRNNFDGGMIEGGDGSDFFGKWKFEEGGKIAFAWGDEYGKDVLENEYFTCGSFSFEVKKSLSLGNCQDAVFNGTFTWKEE